MNNETTASQPKSIGDDAQFMRLLTDVETSQRWTKQMSDASAKLIAYLDSCGPAAQASATIQAAPKTSFDDYWWEARHQVRTQKEHARQAWEFALKSAATIQEPVMVAEPVGDTPETIQWRNIQKVVAAVADFCFGSKDDPVYGASHCAVTTCLTAMDGVQVTLEPLAATVKAVPSEALPVVKTEYRRNTWDGKACQTDDQRMARLWKQDGYEVWPDPFAAPLADKTGGGE